LGLGSEMRAAGGEVGVTGRGHHHWNNQRMAGE